MPSGCGADSKLRAGLSKPSGCSAAPRSRAPLASQHARMLRCSHPSCDRHAKAHRLDTAWCSAGSLICDYSTSTRWRRERTSQAGGLYRASATAQSVYKLWKDRHKLQSKTCSRLHAYLQAGPDFIRHRHEPHPSLVHRAAGAAGPDFLNPLPSMPAHWHTLANIRMHG